MLSLTVWAWRCRKAVGGKGSLTDPLNYLINELIIRLFVEQPLALPGSAKYHRALYVKIRADTALTNGPPNPSCPKVICDLIKEEAPRPWLCLTGKRSW